MDSNLRRKNKMALKKHVELKNGTVGEYWKISQYSVDRESAKIYCTISLYKNKDLADNGGSPLVSDNYTFQSSKLGLDGDIVKACYDSIKQFVRTGNNPLSFSKLKQDLTNAEDC